MILFFIIFSPFFLNFRFFLSLPPFSSMYPLYTIFTDNSSGKFFQRGLMQKMQNAKLAEPCVWLLPKSVIYISLLQREKANVNCAFWQRTDVHFVTKTTLGRRGRRPLPAISKSLFGLSIKQRFICLSSQLK